ncbi:MAG: hypothetical protein GYA23_08580 [Methanomicrobiales archaeon]|nr:hypothetical protein [Methanomicrobiales archaeon]
MDSCTGTASCVPLIPHTIPEPDEQWQETTLRKKSHGRPGIKHDSTLTRDRVFDLVHDNVHHIISENYSYKTESYYSILRYEMEGRPVMPQSRFVLDAYVVPICLERAHLAGIPVCEWGISQGYAPHPSILYGLNYFADTSEHYVVTDDAKAAEVARHLTNKGKYPFCYQKLAEDATISTCISVFGKTVGKCEPVSSLAKQVYSIFSLPLVTMVVVNEGATHRLSSLSPTKYSQLSHDERDLLQAHLVHQEFL